MVLIEYNNTIYLVEDMINSLANPLKFEDNYVIIELRPKVYYPNNNNAQSFTLPYKTSIPVECDGMLPHLAICRPTKYEVENFEKIALTSKFDWDTYGKG